MHRKVSDIRHAGVVAGLSLAMSGFAVGCSASDAGPAAEALE